MPVNSLSFFLSELFTNLQNVNYCVLRNYESLPESISGSDVDILISPSHFPEFIKIFKENSEKYGFEIVSEYNKDFRIKHIKIFNINNLFSARFDLMTAIGANGIKIFDFVDIENEIIVFKNMKVLNNKFSLAITILQNLISTRGKLKRKYYNKINMLSSEEKEDLRFFIQKKIGRVLSGKLIEASDFEKMNFIITEKKKKAQLQLMLKSPSNFLLKPLRKILLFFSRMFNPPGKFVVLLGPDGSGKSTIAKGLRESLKLFYPNIVYEHLYPKFLPRLQDLISSIVRKNKEVNNSEAKSEWELRNKKNGLFKSLFSMFYYSINYTFGYWLIVFPHLLKGDLVIFDRYFYDYLYDPKSKGISLPNWLVKIFIFFYPKPDKVIVYSVEPNILLSRKNEIPHDEIVLQQNKITDLLKEFENFVVIDNSGKLEETVNNSIKEIVIL